MSKKSHSGLKRTLAWMLTVAMMAQGCIVYADDFTSEPDAAVVSEAVSEADTSADSDLEFADDGEETSTDEDTPDISDEDITSDTADDQQTADDAAVEDPFSDGSDIATFSDGADAVGDETSKEERGRIEIANGKYYDYARFKDASGYYKWAVANYPANNTEIDMCVGEKRTGVMHSMYSTNTSYKTLADLKKVLWNSASSYGAYRSVSWSSSNENVVKVQPYWANTEITAAGVGEADVTGTWIGYDKSASSSSRVELGRVVVTYHVKVTEPPEAVNALTDKIDLQGQPTTPELLASAKEPISSPYTVNDVWGSKAPNNYLNIEASDSDGLSNAKATYTAYLASGTINHAYTLDFHKMLNRSLEKSATSPSERALSIKETFIRPVKTPADGIYLIGSTPVRITKRNNTATINVQVFRDGAQTTTDLGLVYEFSDPGIAEVKSQSVESGTKTMKITVKGLAPGRTTMTVKSGNLPVATVEVQVNGVDITEPDKKIEMSLDDEIKEHQITYKVYDFTKADPDVTANTTVKWTIKDTSIAAIDTDGAFRIKNPGTTTIEGNVSINNTSDTDSVTLTVTGSGSLQLDQDELKLKKDGTAKIKATASYNDTTVSDATIEWGSENEKVATVDNQGNVKAVGYGTTQITAEWKAENGKTYSAKATVKVVYDGLYVADTQSEVTLSQNGTMQIAWQLQNMGEIAGGKKVNSSGYTSSSDVTWKSADEKIATVDEKGLITAGTKNGQTTVTASYTQNRKTISKEIKVNVIDCKTVMSGETIELTGTEGVDGGEHTWRNGFYRNGDFRNTENNINAVGTTATAKVTGKVPATDPVGITHGFYVNLESIEASCAVSETIRVKVDGADGLYLDNTSIETEVGAGARPSIIGKVYKDNAAVSDATIKYTVEDKSIVRLEEMENNNKACYVVGIAPGKTVVTATWESFSATCDVTVTSDKRIILSPSDKLTVLQNGTETITAKAWDGSKYVDDATITWESYDESVVTVKDGVVTGVDRGSAAVVAKWDDLVSSPVQVTVVPSRSVTVTTEWNDHDNQDGIRPEKTTLQLTANNKKVGDPVELNADNNWTYEWKLLEAEDAKGNNIVYRVTAEDPEEYTAKVTGSADDGFVVTYSHEIAKVDATANVTWDDADNQDGIRPTSVSLQLKNADGNVGDNVTVKADADGNWTKTWTDLPKYKAGKAVEYTVEESGLPEGYTQATTGTAKDGFTITNSYTPKGVDITVSVNWDDAENQDGIRPDSVEAELYADNVSTNKKVKLTADSDWKATFEKLAVNKNGKPISYTLSATKVDGYTSTTTGSGAEGLVLNYTHQVKTIDVKATVKWADGDNKDGVRPETVSLQLKADGENSGDVITVNEKSNWTKTWSGLGEYKAGQKVTYTVEVVGLKGGEDGYTSEVTGDATTGFTVTATHVPAVANVTASIAWDDADNQDAIRPSLVEAELYAGDMSTGKKVKLTADNKWTAAFGEMDLKKDGKEIAYTLVATKVDGYTCTVEGSAAKGLTLKYTHTTYKTDVTVTTKWNDADNQDGIRPGAYSLQLTADGEALGDAITLNEAGNFSKTWTGLEKNKAGKAITYSVKASDIAKGYTAAVENTESGIVVTLTHTPEVAALAVSATWDDAENQDGVRPASVEAEVLANGEATGNKVTLTAEGEWKAAVKDLPVYAVGQKIAYTLKADVDAYTSECTSAADGLVLKFTHKTETVDVTLTTKWNDKDNQDNVRPASYYVQLLADGVKVGDKIILESASDFSKTWTGLQKNRTGKVGEAIVYTAEVTGFPESYETSVSGDAATGLVVTNTYIPATVEIPVSVQWDDADNQDGARLESVEAELYADGQATGNKVTLNADNSWTAKFAKVDVKKDGTRISYEIKSTEAAGYTVAATGDILADEGVVLTYKHVPATVSVSAKAAWDDADNQDGIRPTDTLLQLYADGEALGEKVVLESERDWTRIWADLPKYKAGKEIVYTVVASAVNGYSVNVSGSIEEGFTVAYAHSVAKTKVTVKNTWSDLNNVVDSRPSKLVVEIYANGKSTGKRVTLTSANKWTASVSNLDKNAAGKAISYTGKVVSAPSGYSISIKASNGTVTVTSKYTRYTKKLTVKLSKTTYVYNGKTQKPTVTVYNGNKKVASKYYTVTYKNNKNAGYATVIVKGKSGYAKYAGKAAFIIRPKQMRKPSVKSTAKRTLAVTWTRDAQATKYVVQYSQSSKFTGKTTKSVTISKNTITKTTLKGLTSGKYYYVRVRSYKVANGKNIYAPSWSQVVKVKVK